MVRSTKKWDYLIVTASNELQAQAYEAQLQLRQKLGFLEDAHYVLVVADPGGKRIGSGGSTLVCLLEVLNREAMKKGLRPDSDACDDILNGLRILIIHAGGDSRRLPAYGPCGKIFVPLPGESDRCVPMTLFDQQVPTYLSLPASADAAGQVVITSGDVLLQFDPSKVQFAKEGLTGLGCYAAPQEAAKHGVFCQGKGDEVRLFLQKPSPEEQKQTGATDHYGRTILDLGVMSFDAGFAARLLRAFGMRVDSAGKFGLSGTLGAAVFDYGLDFYRELCCGMGSEITLDYYVKLVRQCGCRWEDALLGELFKTLAGNAFHVKVLPFREFLHFGTSRQLISSGNFVLQHETGTPSPNRCLSINNEISGSGKLIGSDAWIEGCRIRSELTVGGHNVMVGVDVEMPLSIPWGACLDVIAGRSRHEKPVWFVRCYGIGDMFDATDEQKMLFCGMPVHQWLTAVDAATEKVWPSDILPGRRNLWNARLFPTVEAHQQYRDWLWMFEPASAADVEKEKWRAAERYSLAEIAALTDLDAFHHRRIQLCAHSVIGSLRTLFGHNSRFSAAELAYILQNSDDQAGVVSSLISEARWWYINNGAESLDSLVFARVIHTMGSALLMLEDGGIDVARVLLDAAEHCAPAERQWLDSLGLSVAVPVKSKEWIERAKHCAFESLNQAIISSGDTATALPRNALRSDEIIWGRAPARFDTGGGWTDTPPYSLEYGGCVVNTAVNLNGQPPIQVYLRVIEEPVIRIGSIDLGTRIEITSLDTLLDYRQPSSEYALVKAALALSGFSPQAALWPEHITLQGMLAIFGGGIELTTLAAIPKGSGLGTSSIMGAVILAVIHRAIGRTFTQRELFHAVLRLEQSLTTGGGWQDQIGGVVGGTKIVSVQAGLIPDARIDYIPPDVLNPRINGGQTLLYYTGITRLAKNILSQVVGRYLDRHRTTVATLQRIREVAEETATSLSQKDIQRFGELVDAAWELNKQLDPNSTTEQVEALLAAVRPYVFGAKLLGAGGGGFLLMVCKSPYDAQKIRQMLDANPPNERARFFDFDINPNGLVVTVC